MAFGTGHGATLTFATSGLTLAIRQIDGAEWSGPTPDFSHLGTTLYNMKGPSDLHDHGPWAIEYLWDTAADLIAPGTKELITLTYRQGEGETAAATRAGNGMFTAIRDPDLRSNQENMGRAQIQWEQYPTWTKATTGP